MAIVIFTVILARNEFTIGTDHCSNKPTTYENLICDTVGLGLRQNIATISRVYGTYFKSSSFDLVAKYATKSLVLLKNAEHKAYRPNSEYWNPETN